MYDFVIHCVTINDDYLFILNIVNTAFFNIVNTPFCTCWILKSPYHILFICPNVAKSIRHFTFGELGIFSLHELSILDIVRYHNLAAYFALFSVFKSRYIRVYSQIMNLPPITLFLLWHLSVLPYDTLYSGTTLLLTLRNLPHTVLFYVADESHA